MTAHPFAIDPLVVRPTGGEACAWAGCTLPSVRTVELHSRSAPEWRRMCALHALAAEEADVCRVAGCTRRAASRSLCAEHIGEGTMNRRGPGGDGRPRVVEALREAGAAGMSARGIAQQVGLDHSTVLYHLRRLAADDAVTRHERDGRWFLVEDPAAPPIAPPVEPQAEQDEAPEPPNAPASPLRDAEEIVASGSEILREIAEAEREYRVAAAALAEARTRRDAAARRRDALREQMCRLIGVQS